MRISSILILVALLTGSIQGFAQIVVVEGFALKEDSTGFQGAAQLNFTSFKNTDQIISLNSNAKVQYYNQEKGQRMISQSNIFFFLNQDAPEDNQINQGYQHLRYNFILSDNWEQENFVQMQYNHQLRIDFRGLIGTGMRFKFWNKEKQFLYSGLSLMYENELERDTSAVHNDPRLSFYLSHFRKFNEEVNVKLISYYQPRLDKWNDFRFSTGLSFFFAVTEKIKYTLQASFLFDSSPVVDPNIEHLTYSIQNGLQFSF
jgi:hypothetical protein